MLKAWLISKIPMVGFITKLYASVITTLTAVGAFFGAVGKFFAVLKTGVLGITGVAAAIAFSLTAYRDPDYIVGKFKSVCTWSGSTISTWYIATINYIKEGWSTLTTKGAAGWNDSYDAVQRFFLGYTPKGVTIPRDPWQPPLQDTNYWSPISSIKGTLVEVANWRPSRVRLHYFQEKGKPLINEHKWGSDAIDNKIEGASEMSKSSWQKFLDMFDTTIYHKVTEIQNSYYDQTITLPNWLAKYYIKEAENISKSYEELAELTASVDASVPYLVYGGISLAVILFVTKIVPLSASYVRARLDFSLRQRQERAGREAWEEQTRKRNGDKALSTSDSRTTSDSRSFLSLKEEQEFYKSYRERVGGVIQIKEFRDSDRPKVTSSLGNVAADAVAIFAKIRLFWPSVVYVTYLSRTLSMITSLVTHLPSPKVSRRQSIVFGVA